MSRTRCPGRRPASAAIPTPGAEMPLMNSTGPPTPDSRTRTFPGGAGMSTQRSCTSSPFSTAMRCSTVRNLASTPTSADRTPNTATCRLAARLACSPQPDAVGARVEFVVEHVARVRVVGLDDEQARVALLQELALEVDAV